MVILPSLTCPPLSLLPPSLLPPSLLLLLLLPKTLGRHHTVKKEHTMEPRSWSKYQWRNKIELG